MDLLAWLAGLLPGGRRYVSSIYSKDQLYHLMECDCPYCNNIHPENRIYFRNKVKAEETGLHICRLCRNHIQQKRLEDYT